MSATSGGDTQLAWFVLSALFFLALIYPYIIYPRLLRLLPKRPYGAPPNGSQHNPKVALLFCAYNEEASIASKIENIREIKERFPHFMVHAYTDCCSDGTVAMLRAASDVVTLREGTARVGKASGMRELVAATDAEIIIFTDANVTISPDSVSRIVSYFSDPEIGTVAGKLRYTNPDDGEAARVSALYWNLEELIKLRESETGSTTGADGSTFAMRRSLYPNVPPDLLDDMIASINPIFHGFRVVSAADVLAFEKAPTASRDEFRRKRRIACRAFSTHRYLAPRLRKTTALNRFKYYSHKYMRWFSALFMLLSVFFAIMGIAAMFGWGFAIIVFFVGVAVLAAGRKLRIPIISGAAEIIAQILAVGIGVAEAAAGRKYQTWDPAKSRD